MNVNSVHQSNKLSILKDRDQSTISFPLMLVNKTGRVGLVACTISGSKVQFVLFSYLQKPIYRLALSSKQMQLASSNSAKS